MKTGILIYAIISLIVMLIGPALIHSLLGVPHEFFGNTMIIAGFWLALGVFMNGGIIYSSLEKDMKQPHLWLHSPASMLEFITVKAVFSTLVTVCLTIWVKMLIVVIFFFSEVTLPVTYSDAFFTSISVLIAIVLKSIFIMSIVVFFWSVYQVFRSRIGKLAFILTLGLFIFASYLWEQLRAAFHFHTMQVTWPIKLTNPLFHNELTSYFFTGIVRDAITSIGSLGFYGLLTIMLIWLGALLFEKKVRF